MPGMASLSSVVPAPSSRLNDAISEMRFTPGGSIDMGWSNSPPRVDWYMIFAMPSSSFAISKDDVLPPIKSTDFGVKS